MATEANPIHFVYELLDVGIQILPVVYIENDVKMLIISWLVVDEMPGVLAGIFFIGAGFGEEEVDEIVVLQSCLVGTSRASSKEDALWGCGGERHDRDCSYKVIKESMGHRPRLGY